MKTLISSPGALRILAISIVARLPLAMLGIAIRSPYARWRRDSSPNWARKGGQV